MGGGLPPLAAYRSGFCGFRKKDVQNKQLLYFPEDVD